MTRENNKLLQQQSLSASCSYLRQKVIQYWWILSRPWFLYPPRRWRGTRRRRLRTRRQRLRLWPAAGKRRWRPPSRSLRQAEWWSGCRPRASLASSLSSLWKRNTTFSLVFSVMKIQGVHGRYMKAQQWSKRPPDIYKKFAQMFCGEMTFLVIVFSEPFPLCVCVCVWSPSIKANEYLWLQAGVARKSQWFPVWMCVCVSFCVCRSKIAFLFISVKIWLLRCLWKKGLDETFALPPGCHPHSHQPTKTEVNPPGICHPMESATPHTLMCHPLHGDGGSEVPWGQISSSALFLLQNFLSHRATILTDAAYLGLMIGILAIVRWWVVLSHLENFVFGSSTSAVRQMKSILIATC